LGEGDESENHKKKKKKKKAEGKKQERRFATNVNIVFYPAPSLGILHKQLTSTIRAKWDKAVLNASCKS
jgi:hypothetical protein